MSLSRRAASAGGAFAEALQPHQKARTAGGSTVLERTPVPNQARRPVQVEAFAEGLQPHQKARTADGSTVLERAVVEHNLAAAGRLYNNVYFAELGPLLGVAPGAAEAIAARMIAEKRLSVRGHESLSSSLCDYSVDTQQCNVQHRL